MEETEESNANKKCTPKRSFRRTNPHDHQLLQYSNPFGFINQNQYHSYPALLPLPPPIPLQLTATLPLPQNQSCRSKTHLQKPSWKPNNPPPRATSSDTQVSVLAVLPGTHYRGTVFCSFFFFFFVSVLIFPHLYRSIYMSLIKRKPTFLAKGVVIFWFCRLWINSVEWHSIMHHP